MGDFRAAARRRWAVLPRNSAVFGWREGAARRFSARRTSAGTRGEKIFKNFLERGEKPEKWGAGGVGRWLEGIPHRVCGATFGSGNETSSSVARGAVRHQRFTPLIYGESVASSIARSMLVLWRHLCLSDTRFSNLHLWLEATLLPYPGYDHILSK